MGFLTVAVPGVFYLAGPMKAYMFYPITFIGNMPWWQHLLLILLTAGAILLLALATRRPGVRRTITLHAPTLIAAIVIVAACYALFLRHPSGRLATHDAYALRTFANFYVTVPAVLAALVGYALYARTAFWRSPVFFILVAIFGFFTSTSFGSSRNTSGRRVASCRDPARDAAVRRRGGGRGRW